MPATLTTSDLIKHAMPHHFTDALAVVREAEASGAIDLTSWADLCLSQIHSEIYAGQMEACTEQETAENGEDQTAELMLRCFLAGRISARA